MTVNRKLEKLRQILKREKLAGYVVNSADPHFSEYPAECFKNIKFLSGFTGSNGIIVVTQDEALLWTDSRYFIQCAEEIKGTEFNLRKMDGPERIDYKEYLRNICSKSGEAKVEACSKGGEKKIGSCSESGGARVESCSESSEARIGIWAESLSVEDYNSFKKNEINIVPTKNYIEEIRESGPVLNASPLREVPKKYEGESRTRKVQIIRGYMLEKKLDYLFVTSLDDIAWILNLRGADIRYTPVFYSYLLIGKNKLILFTEKNRVIETKSGQYRELSYDDIEVLDYGSVFEYLKDLKGRLALNPKKTNYRVLSSVKKAEIVYEEKYPEILKAVKNRAECAGIRRAHVKDGVALVKLLHYLSSHAGKQTGKSGNPLLKKTATTLAEKAENLSELSVSHKLEEFKKQDSDYIEPSFETISAFNSHGAIVHYSADEKSDMRIEGDGLLVFDSGSQYPYGTTDITRTILFGRATPAQKRDYTAVLKGHLALKQAVFPSGTAGYGLDVLAKEAMWKTGATYYHGTGHGVGFNLSVHEGPQSISIRQNQTELREGMILSDEPGIYREGKWGIRIENLVLVRKSFESEFGKFLCFEDLTLCPYERGLIDKKMLTDEEIIQINNYHARIYSILSKDLSPSDEKFLKRITKPI